MPETTPADVVTELLAEWNTGVFALPTIRDVFLKEAVKVAPAIGVGWGELRYEIDSRGACSKDLLMNGLIINIIADNYTDLLLMMGEVRRIINGKDLSGLWHIEGAVPKKQGKNILMPYRMLEKVEGI